MAVNAKGDAAIVFPVCRDAACTKVLVYLAVRAAGTSTFRSTRLADGSGPLPQVAAAINDRGDAMAVWTQAGALYARIRTAGGTVRPRRRVGPADPRTSTSPPRPSSASIARSSSAGSRRRVSGATARAPGPPGSPRRATAARSRRRSSPRSRRSAPAVGARRRASASRYGAQGRAVVAWTGYEGGRFLVRQAGIRGAANNPSQSLTGVATLSHPPASTRCSRPSSSTGRARRYALMLAASAARRSRRRRRARVGAGERRRGGRSGRGRERPSRAGSTRRCCPTAASSRRGRRSTRATSGPSARRPPASLARRPPRPGECACQAGSTGRPRS